MLDPPPLSVDTFCLGVLPPPFATLGDGLIWGEWGDAFEPDPFRCVFATLPPPLLGAVILPLLAAGPCITG
eukprot:5645354-Amphidinium_carterae.1